jgi:flagellar motor switch protein FliN/FliY
MAEEGTPTPIDPQQPGAVPPADAAPVEATAPAQPADGAPAPLPLPNFTQPGKPPPPKAIDLLSDVNLNVKIELGRTRMLVEDVLKLSEGAVVELDKLAGDPVDVYVNDRHVARGEVLVLNDNFCVRINEILSPAVEGAKPTPVAPAPVKAVA